jgi:hypothetical protein
LSAQLDRFNRQMQRIKTGIVQSVAPALITSGEEIAYAQKKLAESSRDTGALIDSIHVTLPGQMTPPYSQPGGSRRAKENEVIVTAGNAKVRYAHLVEYGTATAAAQPYFWSGYRLMKKRAVSRIKRAINKAIRDGANG